MYHFDRNMITYWSLLFLQIERFQKPDLWRPLKRARVLEVMDSNSRSFSENKIVQDLQHMKIKVSSEHPLVQQSLAGPYDSENESLKLIALHKYIFQK